MTPRVCDQAAVWATVRRLSPVQPLTPDGVSVRGDHEGLDESRTWRIH